MAPKAKKATEAVEKVETDEIYNALMFLANEFEEDNAPLQAAQLAVLRRLDAAGIWSSFQVGEWGSTFHCLNPSEDAGADPGCWPRFSSSRRRCAAAQVSRAH